MTSPSTPLYREITLTQGQVALVSAHQFDRVNAHKWNSHWHASTKTFYAARQVRHANGKPTTLFMHRFILGLSFGDERQSDHKNHDTLDNRDENLRIVTRSQNQCNRGTFTNNKSGLKGVSWNRKRRRWTARIYLNRKMTYLGDFLTSESAYAAYCEAAKQLHKEFARLK